NPGDRPPRPLGDPPRRQPLLAHPGQGLRLVALLPGRPLGPPRLRDHRGPDRVRLPPQRPLRRPARRGDAVTHRLRAPRADADRLHRRPLRRADAGLTRQASAPAGSAVGRGVGSGSGRRSRPAPSRSTLGMIRSSHLGSHQARAPSIAITAGTIVIRTTKASKRMPTARAKPIDLMIGSSGTMNPAKTLIMISAAAVTTRAPWRKPT